MNEGEIERLKFGFYQTLALKKLTILNINKFMNMEVNLKTALMIYKIMIQLEDKIHYSGYSRIMFKYLLEYKIISDDEYEELYYFYDDTEDEEWTEEEWMAYTESYEQREHSLNYLLEKLCEKKGLNYYYETSMNIFIGKDINMDIFGEHQKVFRDDVVDYGEVANFEDMDEEELSDKYCDAFEDDLLCHVIENFEISQLQIELLNKYLHDTGYFAYPSQVYTKSGNTYIEISRNTMFESVGKTFIVNLLLVLEGLI